MEPPAITGTDLCEWQPATGSVGSKRSSKSFRWAVLWKGMAVFHTLQLPAAIWVVRVRVSCSAQGGNRELLPLQLLPHFVGPEGGGQKPSANSDIQRRLCSCCWCSCWLVHNVDE